jgi:hypothetical protein
MAFRRASRRESFECPRCGSWHEWDELTCFDGDDTQSWGAPVYQALRGKEGLFVFRPECDGTVSCYQHNARGLQLSANRVLLNQGKTVSVWEWASESQSWCMTQEALGPYHPLADGSYVVCHG